MRETCQRLTGLVFLTLADDDDQLVSAGGQQRLGRPARHGFSGEAAPLFGFARAGPCPDARGDDHG
jgi:hypothetical protein